MSKRWRLLCLGVAACLGLAGSVLWLACSGPSIGQKAFEQIQPGMTPEQVEAIIGVPPGDYTGGRVRIHHGGDGPGEGYREWVGPEVAIVVWLDAEGQVSRKALVPNSHLMPGAPSPLERLRRWVRW